LDELADQGALAVVDVHAQRQVARERMRGAAEAGVVGPKSHLDFVEQALGDVAAFNQALGRFSTLMAMRAALFAVATTRLAIVIRPRSSVS
jgi:hypothetical protein